MAAQPLSFSDRMAIRPLLLSRIAAMVSFKAIYWLNQGGATANQKAWAVNAAINSAQEAEILSHHVLTQAAFLENGSSITDDALKGIVETAIDQHRVAA